MSGIPTTGAVSITALNTNFSGGNSLSGYRNKTIFDITTNAATVIPASGAISFSTFRGKRALAPPGALAFTPMLGQLTPSSVIVTWGVSANATSYYISIGTNVGGSQIYSANIAIAAITIQGNGAFVTVNTTFIANTSFYISVNGVNAAGNGTVSQSSTGYILCQAPTGILLSIDGWASWAISWASAVPYATMYAWSISPTSNKNDSVFSGTVSGGSTLFVYTQAYTLSPSTTYYAFVTANRNESQSAVATGSAATTGYLPAPSAPTISAGTMTTSGFTPILSGGTGPYKLAVGTTVGGTNISNFTSRSSGRPVNISLLANTSYYLSLYYDAYGTLSLTATNTNPFIIPVCTAAVPTVLGNMITYTWTVAGQTSFTTTLYRTTSTAASGGTAVASATTGTFASYGIIQSGFYYSIIVATSVAANTTATSASAVSATYTPPIIATANTPTIATTLFYVLSALGAYPAAGTLITLLNTGTVNWTVITIEISAAYALVQNGITYSNYAISTPPNSSITFTLPASSTRFKVIVTNSSSQTAERVIVNNNNVINVFSSDPSSILSIRTGGSTLTYTWSGTNSPTGYTVNLYAVGNGTALVTLTNTTATSAVYSLTGANTYYTTVIATNAQGSSAMVTSGSVVFSAPSTPINVTAAVSRTPAIITLGWTPSSDASSYTIFDGFATVIATTTSTAITLSNAGAKQLITVTAVNAAGSSPASSAIGISYFAPVRSYYTWTPPSGISSAYVDMAGGGGAGNSIINNVNRGGSGGRIAGRFNNLSSVSPWYIVAATGGTNNSSTGNGYYGGGYPSFAGGGVGGGGGGSFISANSYITELWVVAGGGGGACISSSGSNSGSGNNNGNLGVGTTPSGFGAGGGGGGFYGGASYLNGGVVTAGGGTSYVENLSPLNINNNAGGGAGGPGRNVSAVTSGSNGYVFISWGTTTATIS